MTALPPRDAIAFAVARLEERGFVVVTRNERGDSVYLALEGSRYRLRVSNHQRTPKQRRVHPDVLASLVVGAPRSAVWLQDRVEAVVRDFASTRARRQPSAAASPG